ncbi:MAG TPA: TIM44-like domain-containing protein [Stellaceae bacterium]|nr:TIM44-like domain-containing protein [Stellaceae bacterium]
MNLKLKSLSALLCMLLLLAPTLAEARAGASSSSSGGSSYSSQGSRGSNTYQNNGAAPIQRSITPTPSQPSAPYAPAPAYGARPSFFQQHPFMTGLFGGLAGSWLGGMMFGHSGFAGDGVASSGGSLFGGLLQLAIIGLIIWFVVRLFRRRGSFMSGSPAQSAYDGGMIAAPQSFDGSNRMTAPQIPLTDRDFTEFTEVLTNVQGAWSAGDVMAMRRFCTPEMVAYFGEELAGNQSQGVANKVEDVRLLEGEPRESWSEGNIDYATAYLRWAAHDYTVRADQHAGNVTTIVAGDATKPVESAELWTFMRSRGGHWLLSAIQQL